jgi:hypothetical protein
MKLKKTKSTLRARWQAWDKTNFMRSAERTLLIFVGTFIMALGYVLFQVPFGIAAGGLGGIAIIANYYTAWPVGLTYWVLNLPMLLLGFYYLGRWPFVGRTLVSATIFSVFVDVLTYFLPPLMDSWPITGDVLLSTIYGGIVGGVGGGLVYRAGATGGGTAILAAAVADADPNAFVTIGISHFALGATSGEVAKLADALDLGSCASRRAGSSPAFPIPSFSLRWRCPSATLFFAGWLPTILASAR